MLGLMPNHWVNSGRKTVVITVNMRSFGPSAMFNGNEASNQQEAIFYSHRSALLNRVFVSLHHYDNRDAREMERAKTQWFRTKDLRLKVVSKQLGNHRESNNTEGNHYGLTNKGDKLNSNGEGWYSHNTVKWWLRDLQRQFAPVSGDADLSRVMPMAEAYLKEFAFLLDDENPRVKALDDIVKKCKQEKVNVVFVLLMPNFDHANRLFGQELTQLMSYNMDFCGSNLRVGRSNTLGAISSWGMWMYSVCIATGVWVKIQGTRWGTARTVTPNAAWDQRLSS